MNVVKKASVPIESVATNGIDQLLGKEKIDQMTNKMQNGLSLNEKKTISHADQNSGFGITQERQNVQETGASGV